MAYVFLGPGVEGNVERVSLERAVQRHVTQVQSLICPSSVVSGGLGESPCVGTNDVGDVSFF